MIDTLARRTLLAALPGLALCSPRILRAAPTVVRLGHAQAAGSQYGAACRALAETASRMPELAGLRFEADLGGDEPALLRDCMASRVDIAIVSNTAAGSIVPELGLLNLPYVFTDTAEARTAIDGHLGDELTVFAAARGVTILAWGEHGIRHLTANRPVRSMVDLHGLRLGVAPSDVIRDAFHALGADPVPIAANQVRQAIRSGGLQASENTIAVVEATAMNTIQTTLTLTGHVYDGAIIAASPGLLGQLSQTQQIALNTCAAMAGATMRSMTAMAQYRAVTRLEAAGMDIVREVDTGAFRAALKPFYASLGNSFGQAHLSALLPASRIQV